MSGKSQLGTTFELQDGYKKGLWVNIFKLNVLKFSPALTGNQYSQRLALTVTVEPVIKVMFCYCDRVPVIKFTCYYCVGKPVIKITAMTGTSNLRNVYYCDKELEFKVT